MTKKLFDLDSYLTSCKATVLSCQETKKNGMEGFAVLLDSTCFFPEGGGQPSDVGTISCDNTVSRVLYVYEDGEDIFHLCDRPLPEGSVVNAEIDFEPRFVNMQIHCGEHILSGTILKELGLHNVGFHIGHEFNTIDMDGEITPEQSRMIEAKVNRLICENHPVIVSYPDAETLKQLPLRKKPEVEHLRVVDVQGCDLCGCCGTHVAHTGEIGLLKITDVQRYKGGTRLTFLTGAAALNDCADKAQELKQICVALSCKAEDAFHNVDKLKAELAQKKQELTNKNKQLFSLLAKELTRTAKDFGEDKLFFVFDNSLSSDELKPFAMQIALCEKAVGALFCEQNGIISYSLCCAKDALTDLRALNAHLTKSLNGKGGGNKDLCSGRLPVCSEEEIRKAIESFAN